MKIEWLLTDLDESVNAYTEMRRQLQDLPANSPTYDEIERELKKHIRQLRRDLDNTLAAIEEGPNG